jgi:Rieske Fe-S protein
MTGMARCSGCTRRALLHGAGLVLIGCRLSLDEATSPTDALAPTADAEPPVPCDPGKLCVDLARPSSAPLQDVGGSIRVVAPADTIVVIRVGLDTYETLSALCTHRRCAVHYDDPSMQLGCPCHGSRFALDGSVLRGPAEDPLRVYANELDIDAGLLKITL